MWYPLYALTNSFIGYLGCIVLFMAIYYRNVWNSQNFPFLSQLLFYGDSNSTYYHTYNQSLILNEDFTINQDLLRQQGLPWLTGTYISYLITSNMGLTATFTHMLLWNFDDIKTGWAWAAPSKLKKWLQPSTWKFWANQETPEERLQRRLNDPDLDPHYKLMLRNLYQETPHWWWGAILVISFAVGLGCLYAMKSTLPWWGFIIANLLTILFMLFFGAQYGITGFQFNVQPICQMLAGYMFPGRPLASEDLRCIPSFLNHQCPNMDKICTSPASPTTPFKWDRSSPRISDSRRTCTSLQYAPLSSKSQGASLERSSTTS